MNFKDTSKKIYNYQQQLKKELNQEVVIYDSLYLVCADGEIYSLNHHKEPYKLKKQITEKGYYTVSIRNKTMRLHRIIYSAFCNNVDISDRLIHHKNHNKQDNRIQNLEVMDWNKHSIYHSQYNTREKELAEVFTNE